MSSYRSLNLRADSHRDQISLSVRISARQKNKAQMWERLTDNLVKKFGQRLPQTQQSPGQKQQLHITVGNEVSSFLESNALTDKSLRQLEHRLSKILSQHHNVTLDEPPVYHAPEPYF